MTKKKTKDVPLHKKSLNIPLGPGAGVKRVRAEEGSIPAVQAAVEDDRRVLQRTIRRLGAPRLAVRR